MAIVAVRASQPRWEDVSHLGLRWDCFNPSQDDGVDKRFQSERDRFLQGFEQFSSDAREVYAQVFSSWEKLLESRGARRRTWKALGRVAFGAGDAGILETGLRLHRTYGVPAIPGSAQKGLVRRFGVQHELKDIDQLLGAPGHMGMAAAVTFHDALWVPSADSPLVLDTITVHHPEYYQDGGVPPADWDSPTPITTLSARGTFLFAVEGHPDTATLALRLLGSALRAEGIGARTLKGYGRFAVPLEDRFGDDVIQSHGLFDGAPAVGPLADRGAGAGKAAAGLPATPLAPVEHIAARASVSYQSNTGRFEVALVHGASSLKAVTMSSPVGVFAGQSPEERRAAMESLKARCRKKGAVPARVRYVVDGSKLDIVAIEPV